MESIQFRLSSSSSSSVASIAAVVYNSSGSQVAISDLKSKDDLSSSAAWITFTFDSPTKLTIGRYVMVVCQNSSADGIVMQRYTDTAIDNLDNANNTCPTITFATNVQVPVKMFGSGSSNLLLPPPVAWI